MKRGQEQSWTREKEWNESKNKVGLREGRNESKG